MGFITWIFATITKLLLPFVIIFILSNAYLEHRYYFAWHDEKLSQTALNTLTFLLGAMGVICLVFDILYYAGIHIADTVDKAVFYVVEEHHSTLLSFFKYGMEVKPVRTWIYIIYLIIVAIIGIAYSGLMIAGCKANERDL